MTEVTKPLPDQAIRGVVFILPPLGSGFQNYEVGDNGDYNKSFVGFLARRNIAVFGYSPRVQGLTAGSCESGVIDCAPMANWGLARVVEDAQFIKQQINAKYPGLKIVLAGLSMGSISSQALINANPTDYAGAILIEGTIYDTDPAVRAINANFCSPGMTNHQAFVLALSAPHRPYRHSHRDPVITTSLEIFSRIVSSMQTNRWSIRTWRALLITHRSDRFAI